MPPPDATRTATISQAAQLAGVSPKLIRSRVDRGTLPAVMRDGVRRIPMTELVRAGLVSPDASPAGAAARGAQGQQPRQGSPGESAQVVGELLDRLERQAGELAELRLLTRQADSLRLVADQERDRAEQLERELIELRSRLAAAEARAGQQSRRRWWQRGNGGATTAAPGTAT
jgi:hypothetical protein